MITRNEIKLFRSLRTKKNREAEGLFVVEGQKILTDIREAGLEVVKVFSTVPLDIDLEATQITSKNLEQISSLKSPNDVISLVKIPSRDTKLSAVKGLVVALDNIQDPGNLGTMLRSADWFGFSTVLCSVDTVDVYNSKVVQSSMGSIGRVKVIYTDLLDQLGKMKSTHRILGASLKGTSVHEMKWPENSVLLIGNEAAGLGTKYDSVIDEHITIPSFGGAESLNAAVAFAVLGYEFRRQVSLS